MFKSADRRLYEVYDSVIYPTKQPISLFGRFGKFLSRLVGSSDERCKPVDLSAEQSLCVQAYLGNTLKKLKSCIMHEGILETYNYIMLIRDQFSEKEVSDMNAIHPSRYFSHNCHEVRNTCPYSILMLCAVVLGFSTSVG